MKKATIILLNALPIFIMIALIPFVKNDHVLTVIYIAVITMGFSLSTKKLKIDAQAFALGFLAMILFEYFFVSTGVETFQRNTLLGVMPVWLPFLWGYGFVAIKRSMEILRV